MTPPAVFPAEWHPQDATLLIWPHADQDWGAHLEAVWTEYIVLSTTITRYQPLIIVAQNNEHRRQIRAALDQSSLATDRVSYCVARTNDIWARDCGPITVFRKGVPEFIDFQFNGWGGKYPSREDNQLVKRLCEQPPFQNISRQQMEFVAEGGALETDGLGTLLATRTSVLTPTRNPDTGIREIETLLRETLGISRILWLSHGQLPGDDTDGHIDTLVRFCNANTLTYISGEEGDDDSGLGQMASELKTFQTESGRPYHLVPLPRPQSPRDLPASYANFLIINDAVLVPEFDDPADLVARTQLSACFPHREIIGIPARALITQYGSLHCAAMQIPAGVLSTATR